MNKLRLFSGTANLPLAKKIADELGVTLGDIVIKNFSDSELFVQIKESVRGKDVFVIQPTCAPGHYNVIELLIIIDALKRASADRITAVIPYFGYARQDRKDQPRVAITSKLMANLITTAGVDRVLTMDLHATQLQGFFDIPVDHLNARPVFINHVRNQAPEDLVIVSPDTGGVVRARMIARELDANLAIIDKRRPGANVTEVMNVIGDVEEKNLIIIDDIIDTAGTLCKAASALKERGARSVSAFSSHGVFSGKAFDNINNSEIERVITTDSIHTDLSGCSKIEVLSVAELFAQAIRRIHDGDSIGELFDNY